MGAARPTSLARYLASRGDEVRVIASGSSEAPPSQDSTYEGVTIQRIPDHHGLVTRAFTKLRGHPQVASTAVPAFPANQTSREHALDLASLVGRSLLHVPDPSLPWARAAFNVSIEATRKWRPDAIVVSGPPFSSFIAASRLSRRLTVPWVADYRDLWSNSTYYHLPAPRRAVDRLIERMTLRGAAALVTVSEPLADDLGRLHGRRAEVVLNGHQLGCDGSDEQGLSGRLNLLHTGSFNAGKRDPRPLFDAIALLGADGDGIRVHVAGPDNAVAERSAHLAGCPQTVVSHGQIERAESLRLQHRADVLLLLMWNDVGEAGIYSGKLFEYLFALRPILVLGWPHGVAADLIRSRGAGFVLNDPVAIADQLRTWLAEAASPGGIKPLPTSVTTGLTRDEQNGRFAEIIKNTGQL
jgi:glycosyltransferase involved in cell wall biosynthesis